MSRYIPLVIVSIGNAIFTSLAICQSIYYMNLRQKLAYEGDEKAAERIILPTYKPILLGICIFYILFAISLSLTLIDKNIHNETYYKILQYFQYLGIMLYSITPVLLIQKSVSSKAFQRVFFILFPYWIITSLLWGLTFISNNKIQYIFEFIFIFFASILPGSLAFSILLRIIPSRVELLSHSNRNSMEFLLFYSIFFCILYYICLFQGNNHDINLKYLISLIITIVSCIWNQLFPFALYRTLIADTKFWRGLGRNNKGIKVSKDIEKDSDISVHRPDNLNLSVASSNFQSMMADIGDISIDFAMLEIHKEIGKGATSKVYSGKYKRKIVAIKLSTPPEITQEVLDSFTAEAKIASKLVHNNIVKFIGICVRPPQIAMVLEFCEGGEWKNYDWMDGWLDGCAHVCMHV